MVVCTVITLAAHRYPRRVTLCPGIPATRVGMRRRN